MYKHNRIFCHSSVGDGSTFWYFEAREGIRGPFLCEEQAKWELGVFVKQRIANKEWGGRRNDARAKLEASYAVTPCRVYKLKD